MANVIRVDVQASEDASKALGDVASASDNMKKVVVSSAKDSGDALDKTAKEGGTLSNVFGKVESSSSGLVGGFGALTDSVSNFVDASKQGTERASELARKELDVEQAMQDTKQAASDLRQAQQDLTQAHIDGSQAALDAEQAQADASQALIDAEQAQKDYNDAVKEYGPNSTEAKQAAQDLKQAQIDLKQANIDLTQAQADGQQANQDAEQATNDMKQANIDAKGAVLDLADAQREAKPPEGLAKFGQDMSLIAPIVMGVASAIDLLVLANDALSLSFIKNAAAQVGAKIATVATTVATAAYTAVQWLLNIALTANPIGIIIVAIGALIAIIIVIATKTTWFQTIWEYIWGFLKDVGAWFAGPFADFFVNAWHKITGAFEAAWKWIKDTFVGAILWIHDKQEQFIGFFLSIPDKIKSAFMNVMGYITAPFKAAFNAISGFWNSTVGRLSFSLPSWIPGIGGLGFSMPKLPTLATGGDILRSGLAMVHKGERITPAASAGLGTTGDGLVLEVSPKPGASRELMDIIVENLNFRVRTGKGTVFN